MKTIKPKKLQKGNTIGLLSVSGVIDDTNELEIAKERLQKSGYNVVISKSSYDKNRYMCSTPEICIENLHSFLKNPDIDAIIATRGGYGTLKLLKHIDYSIIKNNPKIFVGFSDLTNLLAAFFKNTGMIGFHGPMALSDFGTKFDKISYYKMLDTLEGSVSEITPAENYKVHKNGSAQGILWGGNLSSLASMCGLDFIPDEDFIFFVEDWHDNVYKLDRMLTQLLNIDKFKNNIKGFVWGEFLGIDNDEHFLELQKEICHYLNIPMCEGYKITHSDSKITIPFGVKSELNTNSGKIILKENYLS